MWISLVPMRMLIWEAPIVRKMLTWKGTDCQGCAGDANLEGTGPQEVTDLEASDAWEDASLHGTSLQGQAGLEGTIYPGHGPFSLTPEHFSFPQMLGTSSARDHTESLCWGSALHGCLQRVQ